MQKLILIGRVGVDAQIRQAGTTQVINFSLCHSESYKNKDGVKVEKTQWFECNYFTDKTKIADYIKRGDNVFVEGTVDMQLYVDRNGKTQGKFTVKVLSIQLLGSKNNDTNQQTQVQQPQPTQQNSSMENFNQHLGSHTTEFKVANDITEPLDNVPF